VRSRSKISNPPKHEQVIGAQPLTVLKEDFVRQYSHFQVNQELVRRKNALMETR
jgi:hypothetical protein